MQFARRHPYRSQRTTPSSAGGGSLGLIVGAVQKQVQAQAQTRAWRSNGNRSSSSSSSSSSSGGGAAWKRVKGRKAWIVGVWRYLG
jgi:hypothetical protein